MSRLGGLTVGRVGFHLGAIGHWCTCSTGLLLWNIGRGRPFAGTLNHRCGSRAKQTAECISLAGWAGYSLGQGFHSTSPHSKPRRSSEVSTTGSVPFTVYIYMCVCVCLFIYLFIHIYMCISGRYRQIFPGPPSMHLTQRQQVVTSWGWSCSHAPEDQSHRSPSVAWAFACSRISMDWFKGKFTGKPPYLMGKFYGFL